MSSYFQPVPDEITPGWEFNPVWVDGKLRGFQLTNPRFGTLNYGRSPAGPYDTWWFEEVGGGGSVILPFTVDSQGQAYIGLLLQKRPLQDENEPVMGVPRGFKPREMTHDEAAVQEFLEEVTGELELTPVRLEGDGGNPNNSFFDSREGGIQFYTVHIPWRFIDPRPDGDGYRLQNKELMASQQLELIQDVLFIEDDIQRISQLGDMMTLSCYLRWLAWRQRQS